VTVRSPSPVWHPFTQHALQPTAPQVIGADGAWLTTRDGRKIFDGISSWWTVTHGHRHPKIMAAISAQTEQLDHVIFAGFTHEPAERVASALIEIAPPGLEHVFFSDSGSTAVEVALKMALGFWRNSGQPRHRIVALEHGYHGDTIGTMSAGARGVFNAAYEPLLFDVERLSFPTPEREQQTINAFAKMCEKGDVAALLVEPLILGAGGMHMYAPSVLLRLQELCRRHDVLLVADEVMTAWGRTGQCFASQVAGIQPDILCVAKGLTGGSIPLAATLASSRIFEAHWSEDRSKTFFHSSSFTANPICCAAAAANLEIWKTEPVLERIQQLVTWQSKHLAAFHDDDRFENVRQLGTITAMDIKVGDAGYLAGIGPQLYAAILEHDVLLRPLGNTLYIMPPYCTTEDELAHVYQVLQASVAKVVVS
jgi:adenosylmethionine---8-amino-7-oxononanoate aminotransferase